MKEKKLVLYYEPLFENDQKQVVIQMMQHLPKYMIPTELKIVQELKMNSNGKIDRNFYKNLEN